MKCVKYIKQMLYLKESSDFKKKNKNEGSFNIKKIK